jgi:hypothetical protein
MPMGYGEHDAFTKFMPKTAEAIRAQGVNLKTEMVNNSAR